MKFKEYLNLETKLANKLAHLKTKEELIIEGLI